jgi:hypothetical protein
MLLVLAILALVPEGVMAARPYPVWQVRAITVYDYTPPSWDGMVATTVDDFNAIIPRGGPRLTYRRMEVVPCDQVGWEQRGIIVCVSSEPIIIGGIDAGGTVRGISGKRGNRLSRVELARDERIAPEYRPNIACHEFMHAVTGIIDKNILDPVTGNPTYPYPDTSCVWGSLSHPGPIDAEYVRAMYSHDSGPRDRASRQHN